MRAHEAFQRRSEQGRASRDRGIRQQANIRDQTKIFDEKF